MTASTVVLIPLPGTVSFNRRICASTPPRSFSSRCLSRSVLEGRDPNVYLHTHTHIYIYTHTYHFTVNVFKFYTIQHTHKYTFIHLHSLSLSLSLSYTCVLTYRSTPKSVTEAEAIAHPDLDSKSSNRERTYSKSSKRSPSSHQKLGLLQNRTLIMCGKKRERWESLRSI